MTEFDVVIPARYASTRLPGKPLRDVAGKPLIERVYDCARASNAGRVIVATDDEAIRRVAQGFGATVVMTSMDHPSGMDRLAEAVDRLEVPDDRVLVNLQGDEPLVPEPLIQQVADGLAGDPAADVATVCKEVRGRRDYHDQSIVKVVMDRDGYALYFSRAPIPWARVEGGGPSQWPEKPPSVYQHIGLYACRAACLRRFAQWTPCELERVEKLEQLRALWHGARIRVLKADCLPGPGVDTVFDLERVIRTFERRSDG